MLYSHGQMAWQTMLGFSGLILSLGGVRTLAVVFSPEDGEGERGEALPCFRVYF